MKFKPRTVGKINTKYTLVDFDGQNWYRDEGVDGNESEYMKGNKASIPYPTDLVLKFLSKDNSWELLDEINEPLYNFGKKLMEQYQK